MKDLSSRERAMLHEMGVQWLPMPEQPVSRTPKRSEENGADIVKGRPAQAVVATVAAGVPGPETRRQETGRLDWPALQAEVAACDRCGLCQTRRQTVFGVGHAQAHWMVVGEAPGEQEDRQGEPFVGAAGQLLDRMLAAIELSREAQGEPGRRVFITNTVKCRPPQNRNPQPEELAACAPVLQRQLALVQPRLVLAMGRFAAQQLLGTEEPIGRLRGRVHQLPWAVEGRAVPVVVTYHPAYLLRNPADKAKAWDDLCLALDTMDRLAAGAT
jgi:DNA polymerase